MSPDLLFTLCNTVVLPGWLLLVIVPRWRWTQRLAAILIPAVLGIVYTLLIVTQFRHSRGGFGSLVGVQQFFENPYLLLAGWIHYLAFDLLTGAWEARDALRRHIPMGAVWPCLFLTFLFGPLGFLSYLLVRGTVLRTWE